MLLSLLLVIAVIFAVAFIVKRFTGLHSSNGQIKSVASLMVGTRERIAVIQVGDEQHLIGVTPHNINHLAKLDQPLTDHATQDKFKSKLASFMQTQSSTQEK
ncbi:MAG: flagellar biosynthetic protein FliO [Aestuariibacter sp.]